MMEFLNGLYGVVYFSVDTLNFLGKYQNEEIKVEKSFETFFLCDKGNKTCHMVT